MGRLCSSYTLAAVSLFWDVGAGGFNTRVNRDTNPEVEDHSTDLHYFKKEVTEVIMCSQQFFYTSAKISCFFEGFFFNEKCRLRSWSQLFSQLPGAPYVTTTYRCVELGPHHLQPLFWKKAF